MGDYEPQPAVFFFQIFAYDYHLFVHTIEEKERAMNRKEKGESRTLGKIFPTNGGTPSPPFFL